MHVRFVCAFFAKAHASDRFLVPFQEASAYNSKHLLVVYLLHEQRQPLEARYSTISRSVGEFLQALFWKLHFPKLQSRRFDFPRLNEAEQLPRLELRVCRRNCWYKAYKRYEFQSAAS